jgi:PKHD-type hydroxylase
MQIVNTPFWWWESKISKEICEQIIKEAKWDASVEAKVNADNTNKGLYGKVDNKVRSTTIAWDPTLSVAECILRSHITNANVQAKWDYKLTNIENVQIGKYSVGSFYDYHIDSFNPDNNNEQRKLSAILFLSDPEKYEGGFLEFKEFKLPKEKFPQGSIIVFPSFIVHRVTPVTSGERHTAVCWAYGPAFK